MLQELQRQANSQDISGTHPSAEALSGETESTSKGTNQEQMVPVSEAIKYRKRAQTAEQQVQQLTEKLQNSQQIQQDTQARLSEKELENKLTHELVQAGVVDGTGGRTGLSKTPAHSIRSKSGFYRSIYFSYTVVYSTTVAMLLGIESPAALVAMARYCISIPRGWFSIVTFSL